MATRSPAMSRKVWSINALLRARELHRQDGSLSHRRFFLAWLAAVSFSIRADAARSFLNPFTVTGGRYCAITGKTNAENLRDSFVHERFAGVVQRLHMA